MGKDEDAHNPGEPLMKWSAIYISLMLAAWGGAIPAQQDAPQHATPVYACRKGAAIRNPEKLSGLWLADVHHRIFGMQIVLTTRARKSPRSTEGVAQTCEQAGIEVFEQFGSMRAAAEGKWFDTNLPGVAWTDNHLKIDSAGGDGPEINLDLRFDPQAETWTGRFHRDSLDETATLHRPRPASGATKSRLVGTWKRAGLENNCMHVVEGAGGALFAWSDDILPPNTLNHGKGSPAPRDTIESYGFTAQVEVQTAHNIFVRLKALSPVCCTVDVGGTLTQDGERIRSNTQREDRRNPGSEDWVRVHGDSCLAESP
jgi:hypothetical protein